MERTKKRKRSKSGQDGAAEYSTPQDCCPPSKKRKRRRSRSTKVVSSRILYLPPELLIMIFSHLNTRDKKAVAQVCSQWRDIVYDPSHWMDVNARLDLSKLTTATMESLKKRQIRHVTITDSPRYKQLKKLVEALPQLQSLAVGCLSLTNRKIIKVFSRYLPKLRHLCLELHQLDEDTLKCFSEHLSRLECLELRTDCDDSSFNVMCVPQNVKRLVVEHRIPLEQRVKTAPLTPTAMPCVTELELNVLQIQDKNCRFLREAFPNLEKLQVRLAGNVTTKSKIELAKLTRLQELRIACLAWLPQMTHKLSSLRCLKVLDLSVRRSTPFACLGDNDLIPVAEMPALEELAIPANKITTEGWRNLARGCFPLRRLSLTACRRIMPEDAQCLRYLPSLEELQLIQCSFPDAGMKHLCEALPRLRSLVIRHNRKIKDRSLRYVSRIPALKKLFLLKLDLVGEEGFMNLTRGRASLEDLSLDIPFFTSSGFALFAREMKFLKILSLQVVCDYLIPGLQEFPALKILRVNHPEKIVKLLSMKRPDLLVEKIRNRESDGR